VQYSVEQNMPHSTKQATEPQTREQLLERIAELERANAVFQAGRRAALNLMEDAVLARQKVEELNERLRLEIAERERVEMELRRSEQIHSYLVTLGDALRPLNEPFEIQEAALRVLCTYLGADRAFYAEVYEERDEYVITRTFSNGIPIPTGTFALSTMPMTAELAHSGQVVAVDDAPAEQRLSETDRAAYASRKIAAAIGVPLLNNGRWVAGVGVLNAAPRRWTDDEIGLVRETAERVWSAVERARAEEALRESEENYRTLFDSIDEGFCTIEVLFDDDGKALDYRFLQVNASFVRQTGIKDAPGKRMREIAPEHEEHWFETYGRVARSGEPVRFESEAAELGRWYDTYAFRVEDPKLNRVGILFSDVTERKRAEAELQQARDELEMRVQQRTGELASTNQVLSVEIEERKALERMRVELIQRVVTTQEEERRRISRDLHDQLGQQMTALRLKLSALRGVAERGGDIVAHVTRLQEIADSLDSEISFLSSELRPTSLDDLGLEEALKAYTAEWSAHFDMPLDFHSNLTAARADSVVETHLYRIAQEALNNVVKHSKATHVAVLLEKTADGVVLVVEDNGVGFDPESAVSADQGHGLGLVGMRERANLIGGEIEMESEAGRGTAIYVKVRPRTD